MVHSYLTIVHNWDSADLPDLCRRYKVTSLEKWLLSQTPWPLDCGACPAGSPPQFTLVRQKQRIAKRSATFPTPKCIIIICNDTMTSWLKVESETRVVLGSLFCLMFRPLQDFLKDWPHDVYPQPVFLPVYLSGRCHLLPLSNWLPDVLGINCHISLALT